MGWEEIKITALVLFGPPVLLLILIVLVGDPDK
jgi:hypothetical protein